MTISIKSIIHLGKYLSSDILTILSPTYILLSAFFSELILLILKIQNACNPLLFIYETPHINTYTPLQNISLYTFSQ